MERSKIHIILFLLILLHFAGCEKQYEWDLSPDNTRYVVIDALLTNESTVQQIQISLSNPELNGPMTPVSDAEVHVRLGLRTWNFHESEEAPGLYYSTDFQAVVRRDYILTVQIGDSLYQARADGRPVTNLNNLQVQWDEGRQLYRYVQGNSAAANMTKVYYDWSHDQRYCGEYGACEASETVYKLDNIDVNEEFGPATEVIYFPRGTTVIRKKHSLSDAHQQFIRSLLMETEWRGGLFDVQQGNIPSNFSNGALGFFGICMVDVDSTVVE